jgi:hypothetical protein
MNVYEYQVGATQCFEGHADNVPLLCQAIGKEMGKELKRVLLIAQGQWTAFFGELGEIRVLIWKKALPPENPAG